MAQEHSTIKLITFTGASGVGKTVIARTLLERFPFFGWLESITTRAIRPTNFPDEYVHVSEGEFLQWVSEEKFVEWVQVHGNDYYGTLKESLDRVLADAKRVHLKTIDPVGLAKIHAYAPFSLMSFYVLAPSEDILRSRLIDRGENEETIKRRLHDCARWDADARQSPVPYIFIQNEKTIDNVIEHIIDYLSSHDVI